MSSVLTWLAASAASVFALWFVGTRFLDLLCTTVYPETRRGKWHLSNLVDAMPLGKRNRYKR